MNEYTSAFAPQTSNAQYTQPNAIMGQPQQDAFHRAMLDQQQNYNNQAAQTAAKSSGLGALAGGLSKGMMMAQMLRGMGQETPITDNALKSGMNMPATGAPALGNGYSGLGLGTGSTANMGLNMFPTYGDIR